MVQLFCFFFELSKYHKIIKINFWEQTISKWPFSGHFEIVCSQKLIRSLTDTAEHICQIKKGSDRKLFPETSFSSLVAIVIKVLMICHQNNSPVVCDGYVKYEEAEVDRLVAILKTSICGGGGGACGIQ